MIARRSQHALHLVVLALVYAEFQQMRVEHAHLRGDGLVLVDELHALLQLRDQLRRHRLEEGGLIGFSYMPLRRGLGVYEAAVIGQQQQAGGAMIEAPYGLDIAVDVLLRQQGEDARMMAGLARTLVTGGLVQADVEMLAKSPFFAVNAEDQAFAGQVFVGIGDYPSRHAHQFIPDELAALLAGAEALALKDFFQGHATGTDPAGLLLRSMPVKKRSCRDVSPS